MVIDHIITDYLTTGNEEFINELSYYLKKQHALAKHPKALITINIFNYCKKYYNNKLGVYLTGLLTNFFLSYPEKPKEEDIKEYDKYIYGYIIRSYAEHHLRYLILNLDPKFSLVDRTSELYKLAAENTPENEAEILKIVSDNTPGIVLDLRSKLWK